MFNYFLKKWDPRPALALELYRSSCGYEANLKANSSIKAEIVDAILYEKKRLTDLFKQLLPEFSNEIYITVTANSASESCSVFVWEKKVYILVSAALIGRPYDHPQDPGYKSWLWLALHEVAHIKYQHLPWFFYSRKIFTLAKAIFFFCFLISYMFPLFSLMPFVWCFIGSWLLQTITSLFLEYKADLYANEAIKDPLVIEETMQRLQRMKNQAIKALPGILGRVNYLYASLFVDPHPPFIFRKWLLNKKLKSLLSAV